MARERERERVDSRPEQLGIAEEGRRIPGTTEASMGAGLISRWRHVPA